jgi:hypothetical protein
VEAAGGGWWIGFADGEQKGKRLKRNAGEEHEIGFDEFA